jgi:hypothetical protein
LSWLPWLHRLTRILRLLWIRLLIGIALGRDAGRLLGSR